MQEERGHPTQTLLFRQDYEYPLGDRMAEAYLSVSESLTGPRPCVLVAHDWSGLNANTRVTTDRLASLGYVGLAVDVYGKGRRGNPVGDNGALMSPLLQDRSLLLRRLQAGIQAARALDIVDARRIAILGFCFGGLCALDLARASPEGLVAAICTHGLLTPPDWTVGVPIRPRLLILHGWADPMAPPKDVIAGLNALSEEGATWEMHAYSHALHAFTFEGANFPERGIAHEPLAHRRSWDATLNFLKEVFDSGDYAHGQE